MFIQIKKDCRAVSPMIAYIMLVSFVIVIGILVFNWMKTYVPQEDLECPGDTSLFIENYSCGSGILSLTIKNNGKFSIGGYFIYASTSPNQDLVNKDLSAYSLTDSPLFSETGGVKFEGDLNSFSPDEETTMSFDFSGEGFSIYFIEIVPLRWEDYGRRKEIVSCTESKIKEIINCN